MPAFVKTKEDERLWAKAKGIAEESGHKEDWAYITGIFKKMKGGKVAKPDYDFKSGPAAKAAGMDPAEELAIHTLLADDSLAEKQAAAYPGNIGAMEMSQFYRVAKAAEQSLTGVKLHDPTWLKGAAALGPYDESEINGVRVIQVNVDGKSRAQIQGNKLLIKWGPDAPPGSFTRTKYLPKWVAWAKKHLMKKDERIEVKKEWSRTNIDGFSVYDLEGKEQVAAILAKIRHDVQPIMREFGLTFTTLSESVAEGSLGFNRGKRIIALNVRQKQNPMTLRKYSAIMSTMLHELAHLRHMNHGPQFKLFESELVAWARERGIYAPGGRKADLFFTAEDLDTPVKQAGPTLTLYLSPDDQRGLDSMLGYDYPDPVMRREEAEVRKILRQVDDKTGKVTVTPSQARTLAEWKAVSKDEYGSDDDFEADPRAVAKYIKEWSTPRKTAKTAKTNVKVVEVPNTFHQVELQDPQAKRKEFPFEGFIDFQGLKIDVENAKGSTRSGTGPEGDWSTYMFAHYGEIRGTEGTDGDKLDVYVGDNHDSSLVVVIHQHNPWDGQYDEDKVVLGCESVEEAIGLYKKQYDRPGFYREGEHTAMPIGAFWRWVQEERNKGKKVKVASVSPEYQRLVRLTVPHLGQAFTRHPGPNFSWKMFPTIVLQQVAMEWANAHDLGVDSDPQIQKTYKDYVLTGPGKALVLAETTKYLKGKTAAGVLRITAAEVAKRLKAEMWRNDRHDQSYDTRTASFYSVYITQRRHNGTKQEHFLVVWYTGNPSHRWNSKTVDTLKDAVVLANKVKPESDRISAEELGESPIGKLAADKWVSVPRLDLNALKDALWVKWVRITSSGQMGEVVGRRMPNGWNVQLLKSGQKYDPKDVRGRPRRDADLIKLFTDGGGSAPYIVKGDAAAPTAPTLDPQEVQERAAVAKRTKGGPNPFVYNPWGKPENGWQIGFYVPRLSEPLWWTGSGFKNLSKVRAEPESFKSKSEAESLVFNKLVKFIADYRAGETHLVIGWDKPHPTSTRAPDVTPAPAPTPAAASLSVDEVTSFLRSMSTPTGGRTRDVDYYPPGKNGFQSPHWSVEPQNRQRLDHYVGSFYNPGEDDDPEGWDEEGWDEEYAGPLESEVQGKLDARFGKGLFRVDIGEKGHIGVDASPTGLKALGISKQGMTMWKKGYAEGQPGAVNAAKVVFSNLLALLRAIQWNYLTSHWQSGGDSSYGDHLLFERLYDKTVEETDALAEKLVGTYGIGAVDAREQAKLMAFTLHKMGDLGCPFERGLHFEKILQVNLRDCISAMEDIGQLSFGMDDFLRTMANDHETHIYLLQQRQGGVKMASALGQRHLAARVAARQFLRHVATAMRARS